MTERPIPPTRFAESRRELAAWFQVSVQTADNWVASGCPSLGTTGNRRRFDILAVCKWRYGGSASDPETLNARDEAAKLSRARRAEIELRTAARAGELIEAEVFRSELASALKTVAATVEDLPDRLERKAGLPTRYIDEVYRVCDELREDLYRRLTEGTNG